MGVKRYETKERDRDRRWKGLKERETGRGREKRKETDKGGGGVKRKEERGIMRDGERGRWGGGGGEKRQTGRERENVIPAPLLSLTSHG